MNACRNCTHWYSTKTKGNGKPAAIGECRRYPPTLMNGFLVAPKSALDDTPTPRFPSASAFPKTPAQLSCGEFQATLAIRPEALA